MLNTAFKTIDLRSFSPQLRDDPLSVSAESISVESVTEQDLQNTFSQFNQLALRLQTSQLALKNQLDNLQNQLVTVNRQRLDELAAKETLAHHLQLLLAVLPVGVVVLNAQGVVLSANPAVKQILEIELIHCSWREIIEQIFSPQLDDGHEISLRNGKRVSLATQSLSDQGQLIVIDDLTQTRQLQKMVEQQQRLSLLGKTAASLAHQIRTPLSAILLYVDDALLQANDTENTQKNLAKIKTKIQQLNQQVEDFLIFSRRDISLNDQVTIGDLLKLSIENVQGVNQRLSINIQCSPEIKDYVFMCQKSAMIGLLTNLLRNAMEAAQYEIQNDSEIKGDANIKIKVTATDNEKFPCRIEILDNGKGMSSTQLNQIGEPFITTKNTGTGLGLAIVKRIAEAHHIHLEFHSQLEKWTKVLLWLPAQNHLIAGEKK